MERSICKRNCWISAAIAGVVVLLFASGIGDMGWGGGLFLGLVTFVLFGGLLVFLVCNERPELVSSANGTSRAAWERDAADRQPDALLVSSGLGGPEGRTSLMQSPMASDLVDAEQAAAAVDKPGGAS